jgi:hypothetical protein
MTAEGTVRAPTCFKCFFIFILVGCLAMPPTLTPRSGSLAFWTQFAEKSATQLWTLTSLVSESRKEDDNKFERI